MDNAFYILEKEGHYQLRLVRTHACLSCGRDLVMILEKVEFYTKKYKTEEMLLLMVRELNNGMGLTVSDEDKEHYIKRQEKESPAYDSYIEEAVAKGYKHSKSGSTKTPKKGKSLKVVKPKEEDTTLTIKLPKSRNTVDIKPLRINFTLGKSK